MRCQLGKVAVPFLILVLLFSVSVGCQLTEFLPGGGAESTPVSTKEPTTEPMGEDPSVEPTEDAGEEEQPEAVPESAFTIYPDTNLHLRQEGGSGAHKAMFTLWSEIVTGTIRLVPDNLYRREGGTIFAERVQITPDPSMIDRLDVPSPFIVTVNLPDGTTFERGTYEGVMFLFYGEGQDFITMTLTLNNSPNPALAVDNPTPIRLNEVVNQSLVYPLVLLETSGANDARQVQLSTSMLMGVEDNTAFLPADVVTQIRSPVTLPRDGRLSYPLLFDFGADGVQAGSYSGKVVLSSENADNLEIPVELTLKHDLGWPLVVLFLSIAIGSMLAYYSTESQERDKVYLEIREERGRLQEGWISPSTRIYQFYWLCGIEVERLLDLAQGALDRDRPGSLEAARGSLDKVYSLHNLRENRDLFDDLFNLGARIDRGLHRFEGFDDDLSEYPYAEQSERVLRDSWDDLLQCRTSEKYQVMENAVLPHLKRLQVLLQAWKMSWQLEEDVRVFLEEHSHMSAELGQDAQIDAEKLTELRQIVGDLKGSPPDIDSRATHDQNVNNALNEIGNWAKAKRLALKRFDKDVDASKIEPIRDQLRQADQDLRNVFGLAVVEWLEKSYETDDWEYNEDWGAIEGEYLDVSPGPGDRTDTIGGKDRLSGLVAWMKRLGARLQRSVPWLRQTSYRTVLAAATLFALAYLGMVEIYFKDATFGDNLMEDYAALIIWGLTANATQQGVFQLLGSLGSRIRSSQQEQPQPATPATPTPSPPSPQQEDGKA
ncbi:MAG: hypothetical protein B6I35_02005 [Anaerolineaceae bacterium 4572_32.2]|nr:MAG: hypothetical protein B6I35_02005 [Anaerolineaceae bacterium 4572_32.2]HEY74228.1 hypothetical protein [Thermoflexia bacterium]